jgi:hypothetical protein
MAKIERFIALCKTHGLTNHVGATLILLLQRQNKALNDLASWGEGPVVTGKFDEPGSVLLARKAIKDCDKILTEIGV